ncbi:MAG: sulfatase-like hydrolase/transferase, partial [Planctomycetota bacterium]
MTRLWLTLSALAALPLAAAAGDRPNVLFIITDDQAAQDLSVYNPDTTLETPTIAALAERGITLDAAYHMGSFSGAVCAPSRTMVMTGRTVWRLPPIRSRGKPKPEVCPPDIAAKSLAAVFNRAGYDTMRTCKRGNSYAGANAQFSVVRDKTARDGTAEEGSAWHADQVLDYLEDRETRGDADPFLIYFGFSHPHDPRGGTPELLAKYGAENRDKVDDIPALNPDSPALPPNYLPAHPFPHGQPGLRDEEKVEGVYDRRDEATVRNEIGRNHACTENIDIQIDRVLKKLEATGELDNTYVFFTSDHGIAVGR